MRISSPELEPSLLSYEVRDDLSPELQVDGGERHAPVEPRATAEARSSRPQRYKLTELLALYALHPPSSRHLSQALLKLVGCLEVGVSDEFLHLYVDERQLSMPLRPPPARLLRKAASAREVLRSLGAESLSAREMQILRLVEEGCSNRDIAGKLCLTEGTVKWHLHNLYSKLNARSRTSALRAAKRLGLLP